MQSRANIIYGRHSVVEAINASANSITRVVILADNSKNSLQEVINIAHKKNIRVESKASKKDFEKELQKFSAPQVNHQNVFAVVKPYSYHDLDDLLESSKEKSIALLLDHITDVANFGAIIRSAVAFGVDFIIIPGNRSVDVSGACYKTSSGSVMNAKIAKVVNIASTIKKLKHYNYWVYAADSDASKKISDIDFSGKSALVMGSEGRGPGPGILKVVDDSFKIPIEDSVESLNVSVAAGVCLYHINTRGRG